MADTQASAVKDLIYKGERWLSNEVSMTTDEPNEDFGNRFTESCSHLFSKSRH
jgi:hypothetical protein